MAEEKQNWWQTLPGILTAIAGTITAITGLIIAVNQTGFLNNHKEKATQTPGSISPRTTTDNKANAFQKENINVAQKDKNLNSESTVSNEINLLEPEEGGQILAASSEYWANTIDGKNNWFQLYGSMGQNAVYGFKENKSATFNTFKMYINETEIYNIKEFELFAGNESPTGSFTALGKFTTQNIKLFTTPFQEFKFNPVTAKYLKVKILSTYGGSNPSAYEFQLWGTLQ